MTGVTTDEDELAVLDACAQAELVRTGKASALELVDAAIARVERLNPLLNAVIHERFEAARREAVARDFSGMPFGGVPLLLKDLGAPQAGEPLHLGTRFLAEAGYRAPASSFLVQAFEAAGFVVIGRTNCPELGTTITTEPVHRGPSRNPWETGHTTGGSSGGSAAAVASGMVPVAHANDGGGSIRIPASCCALVGLKPSRGRVSKGPDGVEGWAGATVDHALTRSVRDCAAVLDAISGYRPGDPFTAPVPARPFAEEVGASPGRLRIAVLDHPVGGAVPGHPDAAAAVAAAAGLLERLGHSVEPAWPAALEEEEFATHFVNVVTAAVAHELDFWGEQIGRSVELEEVEPDNRLFATLGRALPAPRYVASVEYLERFSRRVAPFFAEGGYDLLLSPVLNGPPAPLGYLSDPELGQARVLEYLRYTPQWNATGQPAISLPLHWNAEGLPVGVQLVAAYGREDVLLRVACQLEEAAPWSGRRPAVHA